MKQLEEFHAFFIDALSSESDFLRQRIPSNLYQPVVYTLEMGGKRLRPILLLMAYGLYKTEYEKALPGAFAIEIFHNFTLLHDDIMDNANIRRNKNTVHIEYSENTAILSGDAMSIMAYEYLNKCETGNFRAIHQLFTQTALQICEGQQYDMDFEKRNDVTVDEYLTMIGFKTAVLLAASLKIGGIIANADAHDLDQLYNFGFNLGMAFQLQDDYLDSFGDQATFGKKIGGDIVANKKTYLMITALEQATGTDAAALTNWINKKSFNAEEKTKAILDIYKRLNINELTQLKMEEYFNKSMKNWENLTVSNDKKSELMNVAKKLMKRNN